MRRRSRKAQAALDGRPAIRSIPDVREAVEGAVDEGLREFVRRLPCAVCLRHAQASVACHVGTRRRHGDWVLDVATGRLVGNLWSGCDVHHGEEHNRGRLSFERAHDIERAAVGRIIGEAYLRGLEPETLAAAVLAPWSEPGQVSRERTGFARVVVKDLRDGLATF